MIFRVANYQKTLTMVPLLFAIYGFFSVIILVTDPINTIDQAFDQSILLDGGYRLFSGQIPYRDFATPYGPLAFSPAYLGLIFGFGANLKGLLFGKLVLSWIFSLSNLFIFRRYQITAAYASLMSFALLNTPSTLGVSTLSFGDVSYYTNFSYVLILPSVLLLSLVISDNINRDTPTLLYAAFCCSLALFVKITIGLAGLGILIVFALFSNKLRILIRSLAIIIAGTSFLIDFRFNELYLNLVQIGAARNLGLKDVIAVYPNTRALIHLLFMFYFIIIVVMVTSAPRPLARPPRRLFKLFLALSIILLSTMVDVTNGQPSYGFIMLSSISFISLNEFFKFREI